jgi:hypothetical protein
MLARTSTPALTPLRTGKDRIVVSTRQPTEIVETKQDKTAKVVDLENI